MRRTLPLSLVVLVTIGCAESKQPESPKIPLGAAASPATLNAGAGDQAIGAESTLTGTLREQIPGGGYTYLRLEAPNGDDIWAAVNEAKLEIGSKVTVYGAIMMEQFDSPTLKRKFDRIYFGSLEAPAAAGTGAVAGGSTGTPPAVDAKVAPVAKASGPDARAIGELWAQKDQLTDKSVTIRGTVVKYNPEVMGKNWIHLQDGSGEAAKGTHDITVTSLDVTKVGETITIKGVVRANRDFGGGYSYPLIVENAKVVR